MLVLGWTLIFQVDPNPKLKHTEDEPESGLTAKQDQIHDLKNFCIRCGPGTTTSWSEDVVADVDTVVVGKVHNK